MSRQPFTNLTLRAARWSAAHRWTAVLGWLGFVVVAFAIGSLVGVVKMTTADYAIGDSGAADRIVAREFPNQRSPEEVLIQRRDGGRLTATELRAATNDLVARLSRTPAVASIRSPLQAANAEQISRNGESALVTFQITGNPDTAQNRVGPALTATAVVQRASRRWSSARWAMRAPTTRSARASRTTSAAPRSRRCP
jgi:hypothetical protein